MTSNLFQVNSAPAQGQTLQTGYRHPTHPENPLFVLHRYLRGRYPLAIVLALLFGIPGGILGYLAVQPTYTSIGIIRIAPTLPRLLYQYEENQVPPHFASFVSTQASMLSNRRVLDLAASNEDLRQAGWPSGPEGVSQLGRALRVSNRRGSELITAQVEHPDPRLAHLAVNAVLAAYETVQDELTGMTATDRERHLRDLRRIQERQIEATDGRIQSLASRFHTDNLDPLLNTKVGHIAELGARISDLEIRLAAARAAAATHEAEPDAIASDAKERPTVPEVELEYFVARDRKLAGLVQERLSVKTTIDARSRGLGPDHRAIRQLRHRHEALDDEIAERVAFIKEHDLYPPMPLDPFAEPGETGAMSVAQLQDLLEQHREMLNRARSEASDLSNTRFAILALKNQLAREEASLRTTANRLEQIEVENTYVAAGRISILQRGDRPSRPSKDRRRPLAVFGMMGGAGFGIGLVVLLSLMQGGYRYIDELERSEGHAALLGTIPDLNAGGPEHAALAALSVHHLRNMLQMNTPPTDGGAVYVISSAMAGDGKTSLALSLAMSFAAMGNKTVLVDTDLIGRGLSRQLRLNGEPGLCQALKADTLNGELHTTRLANLWAMPVGSVESDRTRGGLQPEQIAQSDLRRVLELARQQFDTVIIDTGPILGSLEANLVAPMSDRVVLVVSRGQAGKLVRSALDRLSRLGAVCGGLVFNRANMADFDRSISAVSVSGRSLRDQAAPRRDEPAPGALALLDAVSTQGRDA